MRRSSGEESSTSVLFQNPGSDIDPIDVSSASEALSEINELTLQITPKAEWDKMVEAIKHLMGLLNGNAPEYDSFVRGLADLYPGLSAGITNLRSSLVKHSCLVVAQAAERLGSQFETLGDYIAPLGTQLSHGTRIIADCCKFGILSISRNCPSRRIFAQIMTLAGAKGAVQRTVAAQAIYNVIDVWPSECIGRAKLLDVIQKMLSDASLETRTQTRHTVRRMGVTQGKMYSELMGMVDPKTRTAIMGEGIVLPPPQRISETPDCRRKRNGSPEMRGKAATPKKVAQSRPSEAKDSPRAALTGRGQLSQSLKPGMFKPRSFRPAVKPLTKQAPVKKQNQIELVIGKERQFVKLVRDLLEKQDEQAVLGSLDSIVKGLLVCGRVDVLEIQVLEILLQFVEKFYRDMTEVLPRILSFLFEESRKGDASVAGKANEVLNRMAKRYSFDALALALDEQTKSSNVLSFYTELLEEDDLDMGREGARRVLNLAFRCLEVDRVKAAQVMLVVDTLHHPVFASFMNRLSDKGSKKVRDVLTELFPEMDFPVSKMPRFDAKDKKWMDKVETELMKVKTAQQWLQTRSSLYKELDKSLFCDEFSEVSSNLLLSAFEEHGTGDYELVLDGVFYNLRGKSSRTIESILFHLTEHVKLEKLFTDFSLHFESTDALIAKNSMDFCRVMLTRMSQEQLVALLPVLCPSLAIALQSDEPEVRKSAVLFFVELHSTLGADVDPFMEALTPAQVKLIEMYLERRST